MAHEMTRSGARWNLEALHTPRGRAKSQASSVAVTVRRRVFRARTRGGWADGTVVSEENPISP